MALFKFSSPFFFFCFLWIDKCGVLLSTAFLVLHGWLEMVFLHQENRLSMYVTFYSLPLPNADYYVYHDAIIDKTLYKCILLIAPIFSSQNLWPWFSLQIPFS